MKSDIEKIYLIDRFLKGELFGPALDEFKNRMRTDQDFALEVDSQKAIIEGIKMARRQHLISVLKGDSQPIASVIKENSQEIADTIIEPKASMAKVQDDTDVKEYKLRPNYSWAYAAVAILCASSVLYFIFGYYLPHQKLAAAYNDTLQSTISKREYAKVKDEDEIDPELAPNPFTNDSTKNDNSTIVQGDNKPETAVKDSLQIEKDKKISETMYSVSGLEIIKPTGSSDNSNVANGDPSPDIKLTTRKVRGSSVKVEFWQSVVNFKGYKLNGSNLQLFDVKPEENVNLKYLDKQLYIKKNGNYYKLNASGNFESYQKETNTDIIKALDSN